MTHNTAKQSSVKKDNVTQLPVGNPLLTVQQQKSILCLLGGRTISETASIIGKDRSAIQRWMKTNPHYIAALNRERAEMFSSLRNRLEAMGRISVDIIEENLASRNLRAALAVVKLIGPFAQAPPHSQQTDPAIIVKDIVESMVRTDSSTTPFAAKQDKPPKMIQDVAEELADHYRNLYGVESELIEEIELISTLNK